MLEEIDREIEDRSWNPKIVANTANATNATSDYEVEQGKAVALTKGQLDELKDNSAECYLRSRTDLYKAIGYAYVWCQLAKQNKDYYKKAYKDSTGRSVNDEYLHATRVCLNVPGTKFSPSISKYAKVMLFIEDELGTKVSHGGVEKFVDDVAAALKNAGGIDEIASKIKQYESGKAAIQEKPPKRPAKNEKSVKAAKTRKNNSVRDEDSVNPYFEDDEDGIVSEGNNTLQVTALKQPSVAKKEVQLPLITLVDVTENNEVAESESKEEIRGLQLSSAVPLGFPVGDELILKVKVCAKYRVYVLAIASDETAVAAFEKLVEEGSENGGGDNE